MPLSRGRRGHRVGQRAVPPQSPLPSVPFSECTPDAPPGHGSLVTGAPSLRSSPAGLALECNPGLRTQGGRWGSRRDKVDTRSSVPATGTGTCSSPMAFLALLEPKGSGLLALCPLPWSVCGGGGQPQSPHPSSATSRGPRKVPQQQYSAKQRLWLAACVGRPPRGWTGCLLSWSTASASAVHLWAHAPAPGSLGPGRDQEGTRSVPLPPAGLLFTPQPSIAPHCPQAFEGLKPS